MKCHVSDGLDVSRSYGFSVAEILEIAKMQNNSAFGTPYLLCYLPDSSVGFPLSEHHIFCVTHAMV
ncbi:MAG: hypothetical protein LBH37_01995, partial [Oscillospiraceae bacterium]|jgi:hypothetical protein|nr:hypothetical protein [Oscillospiraceae bacterium]